MIQLTKGQPLYDNPSFVVYDPTGYYNDGDTVICAAAGIPEEPVCRYEAQYIAYGGIVYSISDPAQLLAEILKIDPASMFGRNSDQVALDKQVQDIVPQTSTDTSSTTDPTPPEDNPVATSTPDVPTPDTSTSTSTGTTTPDVPDTTPDTSTTTDSTSTPPYDPGAYGNSLSAPPATPATTTDATTTVTDAATTTPDVIDVVDTATSTVDDLATTTPE